MLVTPVLLDGVTVQLRPLARSDISELTRIGLDQSIWRWSPSALETAEDMSEYVEEALESQERKVALPFVIVERAGGKVVGSTRFANIEAPHRRLEIGWTWLAPAWQRTFVNTEAKLLLLTHAFEVLGCNRVELKTDSLNDRSRAAIARIGAKEEGIFRNHMVTSSGRLRHSVFFSVIKSEWPEVKARLYARTHR